MSDLLQHVIQIGLLTMTGALLAVRMTVGPLTDAGLRRLALAVMAFSAVVSTGAYFRMGQMHGYGKHGNHSYHYHDIYHYAIGAKYYPELGYERLYSCTWVALQQLSEQRDVDIPPVNSLRDLSEPNLFFSPRAKRPELEAECEVHFSEDRWKAFRRDIRRAWLDPGWDAKWWTVMLRDLGFNPPPSWNVVAYPLANALPLNGATLEGWPFVDVTLIFVIGGGLVYWAFGPWALFAYLTVLGTNWIASYRWTGGSFCRQLWFAFLVYGVCFLQRKHWKIAGVALGLSVCMRLFPVLFVFGALLPVVRKAWLDDEGKEALKGLVIGGGATGIVVGGLSLLLFDAHLWPAFLEKMSHHGNTFFMWHIGFKKWAVYFADPVQNPKDYMQSGLTQVEALQVHLNALYDARRWWLDPLRGLLGLSVLGLCLRRSPAQSALIVGGVGLFLTSMPANYYYVWLALLPAVLMTSRPSVTSGARFVLLFGMLVSISLSTWMGKAWLIQNGWINTSIFVFFVGLLVTLGVDRWTGADREAAETAGS